MKRIIAQLEQVRRTSRVMLVAQRASVLLAWAVAAVIVLIGLDFLLRLPSGLRLLILLAGLGCLGYFAWRWVFAAIRFRPTLTQLALRVERAMPNVSGRLASSVEFAAAGVDQSNMLAAHSVRETESRLAAPGVSPLSVIIDPRRTLRDVGALLAVLAAALAFTLISPASAQTGLARLLLPYGGTMWPARTGAESLMSEVVGERGVHPRGQALPLRARVTKGDHAQRVAAHYRLHAGGAFGDWQQALLTRQGSGPVHERLIVPGAETNADAIEVYFTTSDHRTETERIAIVPPPAVRSATLFITPPTYAADRVNAREMDLGPGVDSRAVTETPLLAGSSVELHFTLNKPLPAPWDVADTFGWEGGEWPEFEIDPRDPARWVLRWQLDATRVLSLDLVDEHGLRQAEPIGYRIEAAQDAPPTVTITTPPSDEAVLATAVIDVRAEAQDDVALGRLALEARLQKSGRPAPDPHESSIWGAESSAESPTARIEAPLDLATLRPHGLADGDVVHLVALAEDRFEQDGEARGPTYSAPRRLRIISELEFATQMRRQLGVVRQNAIRMETLQAELQDSVREDGVQPGVERAQAQLGERIAAQREAVEALEGQARMNRLDDPQLESLLNQSRDLLDFAGRAANRAVEAIAAPEARSEDAAAREEAQRDIAEAQQEVREELADLIELLDRDEDTWVVTRRLEGLMQEQAALEAATAQLADRTIGQSLDDLSREDLTELDRIAQRQRELRDEARQLIDNLRDRAQALEPVDPRAASGMRNAARTAEQRELDRDMDNAAERAGRNQLRAARQDQQAASQTMDRMLREMQETELARAEQLLRQLASLIESIERLIVVQENELSALALAAQEDDFSGRDRAMIRLNQNTQAVAAEARAAGQQSRRIARTLDRAADAQGAAIVALRAEPVDAAAAEQAEERSLELLREAKELAEELQQQTRENEMRRRREELIEAYRAFAERQVVLREQTTDLWREADGGPLGRRQLVEARRLGGHQDEIRTGLEALEDAPGSSELMDSVIFRLAHRNISDWSAFATARLAEGIADVSVSDRQQMIAQTIGRLIEALEDDEAPPPEFDEGRADEEGGGEGGEAGEGLIPPVAELKLLRGLQEEVYNQTRSLDERTDLKADDRAERLRDLGRQQRELLEIGRQIFETLRPAERAPPAERREQQ